MENKDKQIMEFTIKGLKLGQEGEEKMKEIHRVEKYLEDLESEIEHIINAGPIEDMKSPQELLDAVHSLHLDREQSAHLSMLLFKHASLVDDHHRLSDELAKISTRLHTIAVMVKAMNDI